MPPPPRPLPRSAGSRRGAARRRAAGEPGAMAAELGRSAPCWPAAARLWPPPRRANGAGRGRAGPGGAALRPPPPAPPPAPRIRPACGRWGGARPGLPPRLPCTPRSVSPGVALARPQGSPARRPRMLPLFPPLPAPPLRRGSAPSARAAAGTAGWAQGWGGGGTGNAGLVLPWDPLGKGQSATKAGGFSRGEDKKRGQGLALVQCMSVG